MLNQFTITKAEEDPFVLKGKITIGSGRRARTIQIRNNTA